MKVLIVGSFIQIVHRLEEMLSEINEVHSIYTATSNTDVLELMGEKKPDILLMGISLPENKSLELLGEIRKQQPELPVIALSISMNEYVYEQCRLLKINHLLDTYQGFDKLTGIVKEIINTPKKNNNVNKARV